MSKRSAPECCPRCGQELVPILGPERSIADWLAEDKRRLQGTMTRRDFKRHFEEHTCAEDYERFHGAEFGPGGNLEGAKLRRAILSNRDFRNVNLRGADLTGASLGSAVLSGADLSGADLTSAFLRGADLYGAKLSGANLDRANLDGANLEGAIVGVRRLRLRRSPGGWFDDSKVTTWPKGFDPKAAGVIFE